MPSYLVLLGLCLTFTGTFHAYGSHPIDPDDPAWYQIIKKLQAVEDYNRQNARYLQQLPKRKNSDSYRANEVEKEDKAEDRAFVVAQPTSDDSNKDTKLSVKSDTDSQVALDSQDGTADSVTPSNISHPHPSNPEPHKQFPDPTGTKSYIIFSTDSLLFIGIVTACSLAGLIGLIMAGVCWYKLHKNVKAASEVDYPAYGVTGPTKERTGPTPGDRKLAQSAQMYHYQHQKQQMIAMEKANGEMKHDASEDESEEENEEGDYTVYECPGLAPTGEMEVRNPLFNEETPVASEPEDKNSKDSQ